MGGILRIVYVFTMVYTVPLKLGKLSVSQSAAVLSADNHLVVSLPDNCRQVRMPTEMNVKYAYGNASNSMGISLIIYQ